VWALPLSAVWFFANLPRNCGVLKDFLEWAGFPWTFAFWQNDDLVSFYPRALAADIAVGVVAVTTVAGLCAWSRTRVASLGRPSTVPPRTAAGRDAGMAGERAW
jgi:hypothetical protein